jgi:thiamine transport system ATP-binding protein
MLDEPLGSLDRTLRERLPEELRSLFRSLGLAALYVTHDQDEALSIADRVAILEDGRVVADDTPEALWSRPPSASVARFLGFRNVAEARWDGAGRLVTPWGRLEAPAGAWSGGEPSEGDAVTIVLRAGHLQPMEGGPIEGRVTSRRFGGDHVLLGVGVGVDEGVDDGSGVGVGRAPILYAEARWDRLPAVGETVTLAVDPRGIHVIAGEGRVRSGT